MTSKNYENQDTLNDTFAKFFGPSEETAGTGTVTRVVNGELTDVVVDEQEHAEFVANSWAEMEAETARQDPSSYEL